MSDFKKQLEEEYESLQKEKRREQERMCRESKKKQAIDTRRHIILGKLVAQYFPGVLRFQPKLTETENSVEFAPFEEFLARFASEFRAE